MNLQKYYGTNCVKMRYMKDQDPPALICMEIDFSKLFKTADLKKLEKYDFSLFTKSDNNLILPIIDIDETIYDIIAKEFNHTDNPLHKLIEVKDCKIYTLFHFFYYNLSLSEKKIGNLNINWNEVDREYTETLNQINNKIAEFMKGNSEKPYRYIHK